FGGGIAAIGKQPPRMVVSANIKCQTVRQYLGCKDYARQNVRPEAFAITDKSGRQKKCRRTAMLLEERLRIDERVGITISEGKRDYPARQTAALQLADKPCERYNLSAAPEHCKLLGKTFGC